VFYSLKFGGKENVDAIQNENSEMYESKSRSEGMCIISFDIIAGFNLSYVFCCPLYGDRSNP
jgi:hypothetical protein